jgi:hypothetical protein
MKSGNSRNGKPAPSVGRTTPTAKPSTREIYGFLISEGGREVVGRAAWCVVRGGACGHHQGSLLAWLLTRRRLFCLSISGMHAFRLIGSWERERGMLNESGRSHILLSHDRE